MNRILKRPMFRMGGSSGTGITSGLDRTGYAGRKPTFKEYLEGLSQEQKQMQRDNLFKDYQEFLRRQQVAEQKTMAADGGRIGYQQGSMPNFQFSGMPGFLTNFGLNLLATPPQGNIFQTAATAARGPFNQLMASQTAAGKTAAEREFLRSEREASDEAAMDRLKIKLQSDKELKAMDSGTALYQVSLESYLEDGLPPLAAERAANFATTKADELRNEVGGTKYGGVLNFDIRDPNNQKQIRKNLNGKVVYDPIEDNYKYIVVRDGEVFFDEFDSIADIKFPDLTTTTPKEKTDRSNMMFGLDMDDPQA